MEQKTQHLILFFEENDDEKDISSNLVHLYMNKFVITEEEQTEISGIYNLAKPNQTTPLIEFYSQEPFGGVTLEETQFWKENRTKLEYDKSVFEKLGSDVDSDKNFQLAINAMFELERDEQIQWLRQQLREFSYKNIFCCNSLFHFIIGSSFYTSSSKLRRNFLGKIMLDWIDKIHQNCYSRVSNYIRQLRFAIQLAHNWPTKELEHELLKLNYRLDYDVAIQNLITILRGSRSNLLTTEQLKISHNTLESDLINDDLEEFHTFTTETTEITNTNDFKSLCFYKLLTDSELDKQKPLQYEMEFKQHFWDWPTQNWRTQKALEALLPLLEKTDPGYQYLRSECQRYTLSMSNQIKYSDFEYLDLRRYLRISDNIGNHAKMRRRGTEEKQLEKCTWPEKVLYENVIGRILQTFIFVSPIAFLIFVFTFSRLNK